MPLYLPPRVIHMSSTTLISTGSNRPLRRLYPWDTWILKGTPDKPLRIILGKHIPKTHKFPSLVSQLHHYAKAHNTACKSKKDHIQLFTKREDELTLLVYHIKTGGKPRSVTNLYRGRPTATGHPTPKPVNAPTK